MFEIWLCIDLNHRKLSSEEKLILNKSYIKRVTVDETHFLIKKKKKNYILIEYLQKFWITLETTEVGRHPSWNLTLLAKQM